MKKPQDPKSVKKPDKKPESAEPPARDESAKTSKGASAGTESKALTELQDLEALAPNAKAPDPAPADARTDDKPKHDDLPPDDLPLDDLTRDDLAHDDIAHDDENGHRTLAATALMILVGVLVVASLTLWAAPKLAPYLPEGVAKFLTPGQADSVARLASLDQALTAETAKNAAAVAELRDKLAAISGQVETDAGSWQAEIASVRSDAQSSAEVAAAEATAVSARLDAANAEIAALRDEFSAVSAALTEAGSGKGTATPEIAAAVAALGARIDSLGQSLETRVAALESRLKALEASTADARDAQSEVLGEASSAIRQARLQAAFDLLTSQLDSGQPYGAKLDEIATLSGTEPPAALAAGGGTGLASAAALEASFARHAQAAVAADVKANAGDGRGLKALGWLRAQVAGRPTTEQEGDSVGAITSRIAARVGEGKLAEALTEATALPEHSQAALGPWLGQLRDRVAADTALADWRTQTGIGG